MIKRKLNTLKIALASLGISLKEEDSDDEISYSLDKILEKSFDYDKIFLTETKSLYLVKKDGKCQRWKKIENYWHRQPEMEKLYFLNKHNEKKLISELKEQQHLPYDLRGEIELGLADYSLDNYPLELGMVGHGSSPEVIEEDGKIKIKLIGLFHMGHKIVEIIK